MQKKKIRKAVAFLLRIPFHPFFFIIKWLDRNILSEIAFYLRFRSYSGDPIKTTTIGFGQFRATVRLTTYWDRWRVEQFEKYPLEILEADIRGGMSPRDIAFYEIGSNIGYSVVLAGQMLRDGGHVVAFETEAANFHTMCDNIIANDLTNTTPLAVGISDRGKIERFYFNKFSNPKNLFPLSGMGFHSLKFKSDVHKERSHINVPLMSVDQAIEIFDLPQPTHLFIDAYGVVPLALAGMQKTLADSRLQVIMVDIEEDVVDRSGEHLLLMASGFSLVSQTTFEPIGPVPRVHSCVYRRDAAGRPWRESASVNT